MGLPVVTPEEPPQVYVIEPPRQPTVLAGLAAVLLVVGAVVADTGGRLLVVPAAVFAALLVVRDLVGGPLVRADRDGLELLDGWRRVRSDWTGVELLRAVKDRRTPVLEVDLGYTLVALSRTRLGRHPEDVVAELAQLRESGPSGPSTQPSVGT